MAKPFPIPSQTPVDVAGKAISFPWLQWFGSLIAPFMLIPAAGAAFNVSFENSDAQKFITTGNTTVVMPPPVAGQRYEILIQYGGVHTVTFTGGGVLRWAGGAPPAATSVLGKIDIYEFISDGTNTLGKDGGRNF